MAIPYLMASYRITGRILMDWKEFYRTRLPQHLDEIGDLAPPWEEFPTYERCEIGWRMGAGEDWLSYWHVFLESLAPVFEVRLEYLKRHPPAPIPWANAVYGVLHPSAEDEEDEDGAAAQRRTELLEAGLIASDIAYTTWQSQQQGVRWPWETSETPQAAARYRTRELWFWSRQVAALRNDPAWSPHQVPDAWEPCVSPLHTGRVSSLDPRRGLLSLAQTLSAGHVTPPWQLGLTPNDFQDSFDDDMGYVDAFRLWGMSCLDDREQLQRYLESTQMPKNWEAWVMERYFVEIA